MADRALRLATLLAMLAVCSPSWAWASQTLAQRAEMLATHTQYFAPPGGGRAPLVILSSGCGGVVGPNGPNLVMSNYAKAAVRGGAYAVIVDGLGARGIGRKAAIRSVCTGLRLRGSERAGDILGGAELARRHWGSQFTGMILAGWSHGGWAVMELLADGPDARNIGSLRLHAPQAALRPEAVILYYPYCGFLNRAHRGEDWTFKGPLLLVTAERDTIGPAKKCMPILEDAMGGDASGVRNVDLQGVTHAFDEETQSKNSKFVYDKQATAKSEELFTAFVAEQVARLR